MDLVDEQHVARFEIGQQRSQIARLGDDRTGGGAKADPHFAGDDLRQRGLAEPRRAEEQHMVHRLPARPRRLDEHSQVLARRLLSDELGQCDGAERGVGVVRLARGGEGGVGHGKLLGLI